MHKGIQIGAKPDAGFDDPLGMLKDCHRRIEHFLHLLCVVVERAPGRVLSGEEAMAIEAALNYFRVGGRRHNADEEESLFPRMREAEAEVPFKEMSGLENDHRDAELMHHHADELYSKWIRQGTLTPDEHAELVAATSKLKRLYERHIELEETVVFPRAAGMLGADALVAMGEEFRARRT